MKTSDKLLISFIGLSLILLTAIQFSLYAKYKKGEITSSKTLIEERFTKSSLPVLGVKLISIRGFQSVHILPSDSLYFELEKKPDGKAGFVFIRDTAWLDGRGESQNPEDISVQPLPSSQQLLPKGVARKKLIGFGVRPDLSEQELMIFCPPHLPLRIQDGEIYLHGSATPGEINMDLDASDCRIEFGNGFRSSNYRNRYYSKVRIHVHQSGVILNNLSIFNELNLWMDDRSSFDDNGAVMDSFAVQCTDQSRLELTGSNLKKLRFMKDRPVQ
jgi:hypothetical protein